MKISKILYTDKNYPKSLSKIKNPPPILYAIGNTELLNKPSIAIVGSRKSTPYGENYALKISKELGEANICIISGLATGIDTYAHLGAFDTEGKTIAVLATSINNIYPKQNTKLFEKILDNNGCIISENDNDEIDLSNFPKRNRIISGLSMATIVIEAAYRSGSSITANYAFKEGKQVFCLPRNLEETNGVGTNNLLKKGAKLITNTKEILEQLNIKNKIVKEYDIQKIKDIKNSYLKPNTNMPVKYEKIYNLIKQNPMNINDISKATGLTIIELNTTLTMMEIDKYIKRLPANEFIAM